jgi:hypothetical protein
MHDTSPIPYHYFVFDKGYLPSRIVSGFRAGQNLSLGIELGLVADDSDPPAYVPLTRMSSDVPKFRAAEKVILSGVAGGVAGCVVCCNIPSVQTSPL